ncbi:hypothetical protein ACIP8G_00165 [Serratia liquefaciens]|uniref:hypothetical protein n=1 Tax=Serratia liquefaciens TaxID=614 RepID=UPI0037FF6BB0
MKSKTPEIKNVEIINNEIILTITPPLKQKETVWIVEKDNSLGISVIDGPGDKLNIPFYKLSHSPVEDYLMIFIDTSGDIYSEVIDNEEFRNALKFKVTLYDIGEIISSNNVVTGRSTPGTLIKMKSYDFIYQTSEILAKTRTNDENIFELKNIRKLHPYKPYLIEASGVYYSPTENVIVGKAPTDSELIVNGSFQDDTRDWLQHPEIKDDIIFTQKEGYGNFKVREDSEYEPGRLEAVQFIAGPNSSRYKITCEIRVHAFRNAEFHRLFLGPIFVSGGSEEYPHRDVTPDELGKWITLTFDNEFSHLWQLNKFGFTSYGIGEMDVRNVSMKEV